MADDLSTVTWSHATNSQQELQDALASKMVYSRVDCPVLKFFHNLLFLYLDDTIMMLEADVTLGFVQGDYSQLIPVMAHPPQFISDLSLEQFVQTVIDVSK